MDQRFSTWKCVLFETGNIFFFCKQKEFKYQMLKNCIDPTAALITGIEVCGGLMLWHGAPPFP